MSREKEKYFSISLCVLCFEIKFSLKTKLVSEVLFSVIHFV